MRIVGAKKLVSPFLKNKVGIPATEKTGERINIGGLPR
jgi:hypothetical protein